MNLDRSIRNRLSSGVIMVVRLGIGGLLLWSSLSKIRQPYDFLGSVYDYELVGVKLGMLVAMTLPWLELLLGACMISGLFVSGAILGCVVLMGVFTFVQASALQRGLSISCGCFDTTGTAQISYTTLLRTVFLLVATALGYVFLLLQRPAAAQPGRTAD